MFLRMNKLLGSLGAQTIITGSVLASTCVLWTTPVHADVVNDWNAITLRCVQAPPPIGNRGGPVGLLDRFQVAGVVATWWGDSQNDLRTITARGFLGLVVPLIYELTNRRVRCRDDLERDSGVPVLAEFGAMPMKSSFA